MKCFLSYATDYLEDAVSYSSKAAAIRAFRATAEELARYGQYCEARLHLADTPEQVAEYPDFALFLGPRGGVRVEAV